MVYDRVLKIPRNLAKKHYFLAFFRVFLATHSHALQVMPYFFFKWKVSWRYTTIVSFIFIAFVVVNSQIFKYFRGDAASMNWAILEFFWTLTPPNMVQSCWNLHHRYYSWRQKQFFKNFWKIQIITETARYQSFNFFFQTSKKYLNFSK